jgi:hypothetical protein
VPQGFYLETAERRPAEKQLSITQRWTEKEATLADTYIGAVSSDDGKFRPIAFFRERTQNGKVAKIDGRVKGAQLEITIKPAKLGGTKEKKSVTLKPSTYLSNFVSMVIAGKPASSEPYAFFAVVEDVRDGNYQPLEGAALVSATTKKIRGLSCRKVTVEFNGQAEWWIAPDGRVCEISSLDGGSRISFTTEKEAKKALRLK